MKLRERIMRFLSPTCEEQRMEFRKDLAKVEAHAEDLMRTLKFTPQQMREYSKAEKKQ